MELTDTPAPESPQVEEQDMGTPVHTPEPPMVRGVDRCDRCNAEAYVRTRHHLGKHPDEGPNTVDLHWCGHHYRAHMTILSEFVVLNELEKLDVRVVASY